MEDQVAKSGVSTKMVVVIAVLVAVIFGGGGYLIQQKIINSIQSELTEAKSNSIKPPEFAQDFEIPELIKEWKDYTDSYFGYSIKYPSDWYLEKSDFEGNITLETSEEHAAEEEEPGPPGGISPGLFTISVTDKNTYDQDFADNSSIRGYYGVQDTVLNGMKAKFYINPIITEHYVWAVEQDGQVYEIGVATIDMLTRVASSAVTMYDYYLAVNIANTFTLKK